MNIQVPMMPINRYERCLQASRRVRWDLEADVIRGRQFDVSHKFLPDGLSKISGFDSLGTDEKRFVSQIQGRTYAGMFGLVERFINAKVLELSQDYWLGDQLALQALVGFSEEELKHQAMFRRIDDMMAQVLPSGYRFVADATEVARMVLMKSTWSVLALTLDIELFTQSHYRESIEKDDGLSPLFKDVFLYHWKEESQHATLDELEWVRHDQGLTADERDRAVDDFIALVGAVDGLLQQQATADAAYFAATCGRAVAGREQATIMAAFLKAYRWQYIHSGAQHPHFNTVLGGLISEDQAKRIGEALAPLT